MPYSEEAAERVQDVVSELRAAGGDESSTDHLLNPDAETDWEAIRRLGDDPKQTVMTVTRVKRQEDSDAR